MANCPKCQQLDTVRKVTYLMTTGTTESQERFQGVQQGISVGYQQNLGFNIGAQGNTISGISHSQSNTHLAQKLAPPLQPPPPVYENTSLLLWFVLPLLPFMGMAILGMAIFSAPVRKQKQLTVIISFWLVLLFLFFGVGTQSLTNVIIMCGVYLLLWVPFFYWCLIEHKNAEKLDYQANIVNYKDIVLPRYHRAIARWKELYHCSRCDVVFIPTHPRFVNTDQMKELL